MSDATDRLRAIANAAGGAYDHMVEDGRGIGALPKSDRDAISSYNGTFGLKSRGDALVASMLDVIEAAEVASNEAHYPSYVPGNIAYLRAALARFREVADE